MPTWANAYRYGAGAALCLLIGWIAFIQGRPVPILAGVDLAFHEASHFFTSFLPRIVYFAAGSMGQIMWPLGIGIAFLWKNRDPLGAGLCLAWAGTAAQNASVYVADAPTMALPLIGGHHDWNMILGPTHLDMLGAAHSIGAVVWTAGLALWVTGFALCVGGSWLRRRWIRGNAEAPTPGTAWAVQPPWESPSPDGGPVAPSTR